MRPFLPRYSLVPHPTRFTRRCHTSARQRQQHSPSTATIDSLHSEFLTSASGKSSAEVKEEVRANDSEERNESSISAGGPSRKRDGDRDRWTGTLNPTRTHLFKLLVPLPRSLAEYTASNCSSSQSSSSPSTQPRGPIRTAFLLHPAQPLSFVSRLILGSLSAVDRGAEVEFRAIASRDQEEFDETDDDDGGVHQGSTRGSGTDSETRADHVTMDERAKEDRRATVSGSDTALDGVIDGTNSGGPIFEDRSGDVPADAADAKDLAHGKAEDREVRWSSSTDLGDFIKNATTSQTFRIIIRPEEPALVPSTRSASSSPTTNSPPPPSSCPLELTIRIPSFASRTVYLRKRLIWLTGEVSQLTGVKKRLDQHAHATARRLASSGLAGLVVYWGVVFKLTFFSSLGWDAMEPVTYLSGLSTVIVGYLFFLYHNREVSYSSILDISVSARQQTLYEKNGLDVERWTELVAEAKTLRKEIARIAADYNFDWKGQLEDLGDARVIRTTGPSSPPKGNNESASIQGKNDDSGMKPKEKTQSTRAQITTSSGDLVDIDATIDEASEEEAETSRKESSRRRGKTPGETKGDDEMEANKIHQGVKDLTKRLFSTDPIEYNSAINQYLEPFAAYTSGLVDVRGSSRIKKVLLVGSWFVRERRVDEERLRKGEGKGKVAGVWDETAQTLTIPTLTTYTTPFPLPLITLALTFPSTVTLHLHPNSDPELDDEAFTPSGGDGALTRHEHDEDEGEEDAGIYSDDGEDGFEFGLEGEVVRRFLVTKWVESGWFDRIMGGIIGYIHKSITRPLLTIIVLTLATSLQFQKRHPLSEGVAPFVLAAVAEIWTAGQRSLGRRWASVEEAGDELVKSAVANSKTPKPIQRTTSSLLADHAPKSSATSSTSRVTSPVDSSTRDAPQDDIVTSDPAPTSNTPVRPSAHTMAPISREQRPKIAGPDDRIEPPFPLKMEGKVEKGFERGSRELGIPTANLPYDSIHPLTSLNLTGIYYGFARIHPTTPSQSPDSIGITLGPLVPASESLPNVLSGDSIASMMGKTAPYPEAESTGGGESAIERERKLAEVDSDVWPMVMSVGWNPYYNNEKLTAEVHIMHQFPTDFYGHHMSVLVLGYIRPELNYVSKDALIDDINTDVKVALASLARPVYAAAAKDPFFVQIK